MKLPFPSTVLQQALSVCEKQSGQSGPTISSNQWLIMAKGLYKLYTICLEEDLLDRVFQPDNPFDTSMRRWAMEMDCRDRGVDFGNLIDMPAPSQRLIAVVADNEKSLRELGLKSTEAWKFMSAAVMSGFRIHSRDKNLPDMFDPESLFDQSILVWCAEAERRNHSVNLTLN